jgi:hypothetical protein
LSLGYNYRYITLQLAKIEHHFGAQTSILRGWPQSPNEFLERYRKFKCIPWCTPPAIINVFWLAFLVAILLVTVSAAILNEKALVLGIVVPAGIILCLWSAVLPIHFGCKLKKLCEDEPTQWDGNPNIS